MPETPRREFPKRATTGGLPLRFIPKIRGSGFLIAWPLFFSNPVKQRIFEKNFHPKTGEVFGKP